MKTTALEKLLNVKLTYDFTGAELDALLAAIDSLKSVG